MPRSLLLICLTPFFLLACASERVHERPQIALVMKSLANEFFKTMEEGARQHQADSGQYDLLVNGIRDEQDVGAQIAIVEQVLARGVDAIVIAPADSKALIPICQRALSQGVVVVNIDNRLDAGVLGERGVQIPFVGPSNRRGARLAGDYVARRLSPGEQVAILEGAPNAFNAVERKIGFLQAIDAAGLKLVTSQSAYWETDRAHRLASAILSEYPGLKALLCANDSMALGAVAAVREAGREGRVQVVGFDNISAVQRLIQDGKVLCTVDQHAEHLAVFGIEAALEALLEGRLAADRETPVNLITAAELK